MNYLFFILAFLISAPVFCQTQLSGRLTINTTEGIIEGKILLSNLADRKNISIILNKGLNIKYFMQDGQALSYNDGNFHWNNITYDVKLSNSKLKDIEVEYTGKFPVYSGDEKNFSDDMGVVAFKNNILRSTSQSPIIPIIIENGIPQEQIIDLEVISQKKITVYINGTQAKRGKKLKFRNNKPLSFLIYAGKYKIQEKHNVTLLNTDLTHNEIDAISDEIDSIRNFYYKKLKIPYDEKVTLPQIFSIGPEDQYGNWAFTVSPTIVLDHNKLKKSIKGYKINDDEFVRLLAHEMAHYYFGGMVKITNNMYGFYHESLSNYMAIKYFQHIKPKSFKSFLGTYTFTPGNKLKEFPSFYEIKDTKRNLTNSSYYYYYLYLLGFEQQFGEEKAYELLRKMIERANEIGEGIEFFKNCALAIGITEGQWEEFNMVYLKSTNCMDMFKGFYGQ